MTNILSSYKDCVTLFPRKISHARPHNLFNTKPSKKGDQVMEQLPIKIYTLSTCSHCKATKKFLGECGVQYEFEDVDLLDGEERRTILEEVRRFNPKCSFPTIIIGDKVIVGHKEEDIREALGL